MRPATHLLDPTTCTGSRKNVTLFPDDELRGRRARLSRILLYHLREQQLSLVLAWWPLQPRDDSVGLPARLRHRPPATEGAGMAPNALTGTIVNGVTPTRWAGGHYASPRSGMSQVCFRFRMDFLFC